MRSFEVRQRSRLPRCVLIILVIAAVLYVAGLNSHWRFQRDSALYMDLARSMLEGRGYTHDYAPCTKYTPGFPIMLAVTGAVFGMPETLSDSFLAFNVLGVVLGLGCIGLSYLVFRELSISRAVLVAAFVLLAFSRTLYYYSAHIMTDVPFTFFALAALYLGLRMVRQSGWRSWAACVAAALVIVLASSIRPVGPLLCLAVPAGLWLRRGALKEWKSNLGKTAVLWSVPVLFLVFMELGGLQYFRGKAHSHRVITLAVVLVREFPRHIRGLSDALLGTGLHPSGAILALVMMVGLVRALRMGERLLSIFAVLLMGVIVAGGWPLGRRYLLPAVPVMYLWLVLGGVTIGAWLGRWWAFWTPRRLRILGCVCVSLVLAVNMLRIGKVIYENRRPDFYRHIEDGRLADYREICSWLRDNADWDEGVLAYESSTVHYFTRMRTVPLPHDTRSRRVDWLILTIKRKRARWVVCDERKAKSTEVVERASRQHPDAFSRVLKAGKTQLLRIDPARL